MDKKVEAVRLRKEGKSSRDVATAIGISLATVYRYTQDHNFPSTNVYKGDETKAKVKDLIMDGYSNIEIMSRLKLSQSWVSNIRSSMPGYKGKQGKLTGTRIKPKIDLEPKLQKGMAKLNKREEVFTNRLETGRPINILYSDISSNPVVKATIFSRHGGSDYDAVYIWAKKYNKKSFALLNK